MADQSPVPCKNKSGQVVTVCPYNSTCCDALFSSTGQGCCLTPQAIPCGDGKHCCPAGYECDPGCSVCKCSCRKKRWSLLKRTTFWKRHITDRKSFVECVYFKTSFGFVRNFVWPSWWNSSTGRRYNLSVVEIWSFKAWITLSTG